MYAIILSVLVTVGAYLLIGFFYLGRSRWPSSYLNKRILFVTAHPDDESMFFGPTIRYFRTASQVFLLCLSTGNYEGLGEARAQELMLSVRKLGIRSDNVKISDRTDLPDSPTVKWNSATVAKEVASFVKLCEPDIIITFDSSGVSGHVNHVATSEGVRHAAGNQMLGENVLLYQLDSVNLFRKYSSFLDCFLSSSSNVYNIASFRDIVNIQSAMKSHRSQMTWFRKLYVVFSRYMVVNTLHSVTV